MTQMRSAYGHTFVGREQELKQLQRAFDGARSGQGGLAMVVGEPGIGKTALCRQLATYASQADGLVLYGHCYEEASLSVPYAPFVEALNAYLAANQEALAEDREGAIELARILPGLSQRVALPPSVAHTAEADPWRLMHAVTSLLLEASARQPILLVLEDLHWADRGSLDLLRHLVRSIARPLAEVPDPARVLIACTYRDMEVDRAHPLSEALAELRRAGSFLRLSLRGLGVDDVHRMYETLRGNDVPRAQAVLVQRQTEGNPLYVEEVLRYLVEAGIVVHQDGRYVRADNRPVESLLPEGLKDVIGRRFSQLDPRTNQVLVVASVIGREFRLDVLQQVVCGGGNGQTLSEPELIEALGQAQERALIEESPSGAGGLVLRFTHAFMRETLYAEIFAAKRILLHRQVAHALEEIRPQRLEEHAAELAEHYAHSSDESDLRKAVAYAETAAQRATSVFAFGDAAGYLERALKAQEVLDAGDLARRCDLLLALGDALVSAGEPQRVLKEVAPAALKLAESLGDNHRAAHASNLAIEALYAAGAGWIWHLSDAPGWVELVQKYAPPGTIASVRADVARARLMIATGQVFESRQVLLDAREVARKLGDCDAEWDCLVCLLGAYFHPDAHADLVATAEELRSLPTQGVSLRVRRQAAHFMTHAFMQAGMREQADEAIQGLKALFDQTKQPNIELLWLKGEGILDILAGRLEDAGVKAQRFQERSEELGLREYSFSIGPATHSRISWLLGRYEDLNAHPASAWIAGALISASRGEVAEAQRAGDALEEYLRSSFGERSSVVGDMSCLEIAIGLRHKGVARLVVERYPAPGVVTSGTVGSIFCMGIVARELADAAVLLEDYETARTRYFEALADAERIAHRPEKALAMLGLAELLWHHFRSERPAAKAYLEAATPEVRAMKMRPALERALRLREQMQGKGGLSQQFPNGLSAREVEVLRLIADGKSSRQIADELVISFHTVNRHVSNVLAKTGSANRAEAIAFAARHGFLSSRVS